MLHLSGKARDEWNHGIRLGVTQSQLEDFGNEEILELDEEEKSSEATAGPGLKLYDWFGSMKEARRRGPERLSIIFAFADPI